VLRTILKSKKQNQPHFDVGDLSEGGTAVVAVSAACVALSDEQHVLEEIVEVVRRRLLELVAVRRGAAVRTAGASGSIAGAALGVRGGRGRLLLGHVGAALQEARLEGERLLDGVVETHFAVAVEQRRVLSGQSHLQVDHQQQGEEGEAGGHADGHAFLQLHGWRDECCCPYAAGRRRLLDGTTCISGRGGRGRLGFVESRAAACLFFTRYIYAAATVFVYC
jgi:hypothetical protein